MPFISVYDFFGETTRGILGFFWEFWRFKEILFFFEKKEGFVKQTSGLWNNTSSF